jgi:hypothetical protein
VNYFYNNALILRDKTSYRRSFRLGATMTIGRKIYKIAGISGQDITLEEVL